MHKEAGTGMVANISHVRYATLSHYRWSSVGEGGGIFIGHKTGSAWLVDEIARGPIGGSKTVNYCKRDLPLSDVRKLES